MRRPRMNFWRPSISTSRRFSVSGAAFFSRYGTPLTLHWPIHTPAPLAEPRGLLVADFPYDVVYELHPAVVRIVAVAH